MKKQFTFALMILLCAISTIKAQVKNHFDDDLKQKHIKHNAQSVSERGALFLLKQTISTYFDEKGKSDGKGRGIYTYNSKGLLTNVLNEYYDSIPKVWVNDSRLKYSYDAKNNKTKTIEEFFSDSKNDWIKLEEVRNVYDSNNNLIRDTTLSYGYIQSDSTQYEVYNAYTYDSKNRLIFINETAADSKGVSIVSYGTKTLTYGSNDKLSNVLYKYGTTPSNIKNANFEVLTYLANNNLEKEELFAYENNVLSTTPAFRVKFTYNAKNQWSESSYAYGTPFIERSKSLYSYDLNGNLKNEKNYDYDDTSNKLYYFGNVDYIYSQFVDTKDIQTISFSVSPNPASEVLTVKATEPILSSTIYDMNGRVLSVTQGDFSSLDIAYLSEGVYFLQVKTQTGMGTTKFIKK